MDYEKTLKLRHHKSAAIVNNQTGEVRVIEPKSCHNGMEPFKLMPTYHRMSGTAWKLLSTQTTRVEYHIAQKLAFMARQGNNSLVPLNDDSTGLELAEILECDRESVKKHIQKLFTLGVIAKFEIYEHDKQYKKYWIFNPWLAFNGARISTEVKNLFIKTTYALISKPGYR